MVYFILLRTSVYIIHTNCDMYHTFCPLNEKTWLAFGCSCWQGYPVNQIRPWPLQPRSNGTTRPSLLDIKANFEKTVSSFEMHLDTRNVNETFQFVIQAPALNKAVPIACEIACPHLRICFWGARCSTDASHLLHMKH